MSYHRILLLSWYNVWLIFQQVANYETCYLQLEFLSVNILEMSSGTET